MSCNLPVGVFDSGVGGLTVVKEIMHQLPNEEIVYFGDTARVPYGSKSKETVTAYSRQIIKFLQTKKVKAIVIACNTASAFALETIAKEIPVPIIGVIKPGAKTAAKTTKNGKIGIIGTEGTIRSGLYKKILQDANPNLLVFGKACPLFVPLVEEGWIHDPVTKEVAKRYITELKGDGIDTLVLGCTHYPLIRDILHEIAGDQVRLVNPAYETARMLHDLLKEQDLLADETINPSHKFYVSDGAEKFRDFANSILPCEMVETKDVNIITFD